jgi:hypothetical protein
LKAPGILAALLMAATPVAERPTYLPTRDVAVTYQVTGEKLTAPQTIEAHFSAAANKLRLDDPALAGYAVIDRAAARITVVLTQARAFTVLPFDADRFILDQSATFTRTGTSDVDSLHCTTWKIVTTTASGSVCLTNDGILLRGSFHDEHGGSGGLEATDVTYSPQPAGLFNPPAGFLKMNLNLHLPLPQ